MDAVERRKESVTVVEDRRKKLQFVEDPKRWTWLVISSSTQSVVFKGLLDLAGGLMAGSTLRPNLERKLLLGLLLSEDCLQKNREGV